MATTTKGKRQRNLDPYTSGGVASGASSSKKVHFDKELVGGRKREVNRALGGGRDRARDDDVDVSATGNGMDSDDETVAMTLRTEGDTARKSKKDALLNAPVDGDSSDDAALEDEDAGVPRNSRAGLAATGDDDEDMFSTDNTSKGDTRAVNGKTGEDTPRWLREDDIEGQEIHVPSDQTLLDPKVAAEHGQYDEESGEIKIEPFNVKDDYEQGRYDVDGNFIKNTKDEDEVYDNWLAGLSKQDITQAKVAEEARVQRQKLKEAHDLNQAGSVKLLAQPALLKEVVSLLLPRETIFTSLARLGGAPVSRRKSWRERKRPTKDSEPAASDSSSVDRVTRLADRLLEKGQDDIYDLDREEMIELVREMTGDARWRPEEQVAAVNVGATTRDDRIWQYRWTTLPTGNAATASQSEMNGADRALEASIDALPTAKRESAAEVRAGEQEAEPAAIHGPFTTEEMRAWVQAGYFGAEAESILVQRVGESHLWRPWTQTKH